MLNKKNENIYNTRQSALQKEQSYNSQQSEPKGLTLAHKYSSREEQQNQKTAKKLEESIIN